MAVASLGSSELPPNGGLSFKPVLDLGLFQSELIEEQLDPKSDDLSFN